MILSPPWRARLLLLTTTSAAVGGLLFGCGDKSGSTFGSGAGDAGSPPPPIGTFPVQPSGPSQDFPATPILDGDVPPNAAALFGAAQFAGAGGPCLMEPEVGSMLPKNWLRPRFRWIAANALGDGGASGPAQDIYELRVHAENQVNDLVVYTKNAAWTMPKEMWNALRLHSAGAPMTMTVRGATLSNGALTNASAGSSGPFSIAPVEAPGTIVYWTTLSGGPDAGGSLYNPALKGFRVGDESVTDVLRPSQVPPTNLGEVKCVGCHTSTPDGLYAVTSIRPNPQGGGATQVGFGAIDGSAATPPYVTPTAQGLLHRSEQMAPTFSAAHFAPGDRIAVTMYRTMPGFDIIWTDLETTSTVEGVGWGKFARTGDPNYAALANASHDGTKIVYVSTPDQNTAGTQFVDGKIYTIPWGNRQGGTATELMGANLPGFRQYYPAFSPDDALIVFDRSPVRSADTYNDPSGEMHVIGANGGTAQRLTANDPPACSGGKSPGVHNSWPKWSPEAAVDGTKKYYFVVFSSARKESGRFGDRLYITPIVVEGATITTYAALYLWNQPEEDNHSPAWDTLKIAESTPK
jgi:hypothetical protein